MISNMNNNSDVTPKAYNSHLRQECVIITRYFLFDRYFPSITGSIDIKLGNSFQVKGFCLLPQFLSDFKKNFLKLKLFVWAIR